MNYTCPVCGYDNLERPPADYHICPCCGTEFGYDDFTFSHGELRKRWIANGMRWHRRRTGPPPGWNPITQLFKAGFAPDGTTLGTQRAGHA